MTTEPVSVAMAVHNGLPFLREQVESILSQLEGDDELVVIDDASSDGSLQWLTEHASSRLRVESQSVNAGIRRTFERAFRATRHPIVFLADQDDVWLPGKRAAFVRTFAADPGVLVVVSDAELVDRDGRLLSPSFMATRGGFRRTWWATLVRNRYLGCAMAVRRSLLEKALPIPPRAPMHDMWLGALGSTLGRVVYLPTPLLRYRRHGGNATPSTHRSVPRMLADRWGLLTALAIRRLALRRR